MALTNGNSKLRDIADLVGCSVATVSNAINGRGRMSEKMRETIRAKCAELNFVPNSAGRSLRLQRADAVGVIYAPSFAELFGNVFYARIMEGLAEAFGNAGLDLILGNRMDPDGVPAIVRQGKVDALVVLAGVFGGEDYESLRNCPVPLCVVDGHTSALEADTLTSDGFGGGRQVAEFFIAKGHREVRMIAYRSPLYNIEQRIAGFLFGLPSGGREGELILRVDDNDQAVEEVKRQLAGKNPPTALFAVNDTLAVHLVQALTEAGFRVPQDVSVVGFDDDPIAANCQPPLTTVGLGKRDFGAESAKMVLHRLAHPEAAPIHQVQPTRLVVRDSVAEI
ncbi:MAG: LacI family DNA-binding transcriptional regulator [Akkermansiaceae bacterium]